MLASFLFLCGLGAAAKPDPIYKRAVGLIENRYLAADDVEANDAFLAAAEELEGAIPWLIVNGDGLSVSLTDSRSGESVNVTFNAQEGTDDMAQLVQSMGALEAAVLAFGVEASEDVDIAVELTQGLMRTLDRHSVVLAKRRLAKFNERIKGKLTGIGAKLRMEDGVLWADVVFAKTPAERGGLQVEDAIFRVDGVSTLGMSLRQAVERIRGPKGSNVVLSVIRRLADGTDDKMDLRFRRDEVTIPNVNWSLSDDGVGIIRVENFSEHTSRLTGEALSSFAEAAAKGLAFRGVILDLRGNSGGSLIQSAETVDLFVSAGEVVRTEGRNGETVPNLVRSIVAHEPNLAHEEPQVPMVVMQNHKSASASEIVAGSLAALGRAVVIGRTSFGKGTVQKMYTLRGGKERVRLKLTVAEYKLEGGQVVNGEGITPDLTMRRVVFNTSGAWIPSDAETDAAFLLSVDERVGWRSEGEIDKGADPLEDMGRALVLAMAGPTRQDGLAAIAVMLDDARTEADAALSETFALRGIDWRPTDDKLGILDAAVTLEVLGKAKAGQRVTVRAEVRNDGPAPLYQARVRLITDDRTPWSGATIPVGFVPPGESAIGQVEIAVRTNTDSRSDDVKLRLEADGLAHVDLESVVLDVIGFDPPELAVSARLMPHDDHHRLEIELENQGDQHLTGMRLNLGWRDDSGVELLDREAISPVLAAHGSHRYDFEVRLLDGEPAGALLTEIPLLLRVGAERFPSLVRMPIMVATDGSTTRLAAPVVVLDAPTRVETDTIQVRFEVSDEAALASVAVWWNGDKQAWYPGEGTRLKADVALEMSAGSNVLTIIAIDSDGLETSKSRRIWGRQLDKD
jgi:carboxyl-terminal processing protease